jgi:hypothetical protein
LKIRTVVPSVAVKVISETFLRSPLRSITHDEAPLDTVHDSIADDPALQLPVTPVPAAPV